MLRYARSAIGGVAVATMIAAGSVIAAPPANAEPGVYGGEVIKVGGWKSGKYWNRNWNRGNWNNGNWNNGNWWVGPAIGFGAGVLLGSALSQPRYYYAPPPVRYYGDRDAYCHAKYRSYNSYTGTYTGYDGRQHYCRIP